MFVGSLQVFLLLPTLQRHEFGGWVKYLLKSNLTCECYNSWNHLSSKFQQVLFLFFYLFFVHLGPDPRSSVNNSLLTCPPEEQYFSLNEFLWSREGKRSRKWIFLWPNCPSLSINQPLFFCMWKWRPLKQSKCADGEEQIAPLWQCPQFSLHVCVHVYVCMCIFPCSLVLLLQETTDLLFSMALYLCLRQSNVSVRQKRKQTEADWKDHLNDDTNWRK